MKAEDFPKLEEYEVPEIEKEMEERLPGALRWSLRFFLKRYLFLLEKVIFPGVEVPLERINQVKEIDIRAASKQLGEGIKSGRYLESLVIMDASVHYSELDLTALGHIRPEERDSEWRADYKKTAEERDVMAYHRDRLWEKEPRLRVYYTKKDFQDWAEEVKKAQEDMLKEESDESDRRNFLDRIEILNKVVASIPVSAEDIEMLLWEINAEMSPYREGSAELVVNYLLGRPVKEAQLLDHLLNIVKFRQFQIGVESREWVNFQP